MAEKYQICTRCVMDSSDPEISFDLDGVCNHCHRFEKELSMKWFPNEKGKAMLDQVMSGIREKGKDSDHDCIIGLSGGVDSSYLALVLKEYNLRPLVVHVDAGWNSELAVYNIEQVVKYCGYELHTHVMDWEEIRDLQVAYLKAGVSNQDVVQDHAFFASLYHFAENIKSKMSSVVEILQQSPFFLILGITMQWMPQV
jgi:aminotransferase